MPSILTFRLVRFLPGFQTVMERIGHFSVRRVRNPVVECLGIVRHIEQFSRLTVVHVQFPRLGTDHLHVSDLAEDRIAPVLRGWATVQKSRQRPSLDGFRGGSAGQFAEGGKEVDVLHEFAKHARFTPGDVDEQGDMDGGFAYVELPWSRGSPSTPHKKGGT